MNYKLLQILRIKYINLNHTVFEVICLIKGSIWSLDDAIPKRDKLTENISTDVAVIGGGMAGILIAERLCSQGKKVVVLESKQIASGQTKNTTAKITAQHGLIYADMISHFKFQNAKLYSDINLRAVDWYRKYITEEKIDCCFEQKNAFLYSNKSVSKIEAEYKACKRLKLPVFFEEAIPFLKEAKGTVCMHNQAQFNPIMFIKEVAKKLTVYENTPVIKVEDNRVICKNFVVEAKDIVFACHYPFINFPALYFARMYQQRSYVIALKNAHSINGMYVGADKNGISLRSYGALVLLGGAQHRTGENNCGKSYEFLLNEAKKLFPESQAVAYWSAQDCITADGLPYIGRFSSGKPNWYVATGFSKWGMTSSAVAAELITDLILGRENKAADVFSPSRFSICAAKGIADEVLHSAKGLIKQIFYIPKDKLDTIKVGKAGCIMLEGRRVGVYRESEKKYHCVSLKCPHLGCRLEWNPDEKSWDCPCHGSRFDFKGELIDNPAQNNIVLK